MPIACLGVPSVAQSMPAVRSFMDGNAPVKEIPRFISGVTRDSTGAILGSCAIILFRTADNSVAAQGITSDPTTGAYSIVASVALQHFAASFHASGVGGITRNDLVAT